MDIQTPCSDTRGGSIGIIKWVCMAATLGPFSSRHLRYRIPIYVKQQVIGILFYWWKKVSSTSRWIADFFALVSCVCPPYCVFIYQLELYWIAYWKLSREPPPPFHRYSSDKTVSLCR